MKKRVVIDASSCLIGSWNPHLSGIGRTTLELIRALEAQKNLPFDLVLFTQRLRPDRLQRYHFKSEEINLPLPRKEWVTSLKNTFPIVEWLTKSNLYHIPHNYGECLKKENTVLTIHDALGFDIDEPHLYDRKKIQQTVDLAENCRAILTCSQSSKDHLLKHLRIPEDKITVIHWGYNKEIFRVLKENVIAEFRRRNHLSQPFILSVSCNVGRKRTPELIRQYLKHAACLPWDLVLVWNNPPEDIKSFVRSSKNAQRIHFYASPTDDELSKLYNSCEFTVFPSIYEGFGLPILEAFACGKTALIVNKTSMPEIAGSAGIYFESEAEDAIGNKLLEMATNKINLNDYKARCLLRASDFSWEKCAKETIKFYIKNLI